MNQNQMNEQDFLGDALVSQKMITGTYNTYANECAAPELRNEFLNILQDEHMIQADIFVEMKNRGWYQTKPADSNQVTQARQKYQNQSQ